MYFTHLYTFVYNCIQMYTCINTCIHLCLQMYTNVYMYKYMYTNVYNCIQMYTIYIHVYRHVSFCFLLTNKTLSGPPKIIILSSSSESNSKNLESVNVLAYVVPTKFI